MNTTRAPYLDLPTRWMNASALMDDVPNVTWFLDGGRIGEARLALQLDTNAIRTVYLGSLETRQGTLSVMIELPPQSEDGSRLARENASAMMALDCVRYEWESGAEATLDASTGYWRVTMGGEVIADTASREDAIAIGHAQVRP